MPPTDSEYRVMTSINLTVATRRRLGAAAKTNGKGLSREISDRLEATLNRQEPATA